MPQTTAAKEKAAIRVCPSAKRKKKCYSRVIEANEGETEMKNVYVGQIKLISFDGRLFLDTEVARDAVTSVEWARGILANPAVVYPNGRNSHEAAGKELEKAQNKLIGCLVLI